MDGRLSNAEKSMEGSLQGKRGRGWRGAEGVPWEWSGLGPAEPRKYHTHGTFVSGKDCPSVKASAAQKKEKA